MRRVDRVTRVYLFIYVHSDVQSESDLSCPGGKARIIHKESDIITAFAINKVPFVFFTLALLKPTVERQRVSL